ncbi:hypothetical protein ACQ4PT_057268 [Festuca glaucescens]
MDRGWMDMPRTALPYAQGLVEFLEFAFAHSAKQNKILCPCKKCTNCSWGNGETVYEHLICDGFKQGYKLWIFHGDSSYNSARCNANAHEGSQVEHGTENHDELPEMLRDIGHGYGIGDDVTVDGQGVNDADVENFYNLVDDASQDLFDGCMTFSKLNFLV